MKVEFLSSFNKDISKLSSLQVRKALKITIERIESAQSLSEIPNIKKLAGFKDAYRIRLGDYRLGFSLTMILFSLQGLQTGKIFIKYFHRVINAPFSTFASQYSINNLK